MVADIDLEALPSWDAMEKSLILMRKGTLLLQYKKTFSRDLFLSPDYCDKICTNKKYIKPLKIFSARK